MLAAGRSSVLAPAAIGRPAQRLRIIRNTLIRIKVSAHAGV